MRANWNRADKKIVYLPIEELAPNPMQPRRDFDEAALDALSESIRQFGVLQPITVRQGDPEPYPNNLCGPSFEIIAGERRWRAAGMAGLEKVPCLIRKATRQESAELALIENLQRRDLGFFEEAEAIRTLLLVSSDSQVQMAAKLSLSPSALSNKLRLLKLTASERRLIEQNDLSERHARAFLRIRDENMRKKAILQVITDGLSASETEELADRFNSRQTAFGELATEPSKQDSLTDKPEKRRQRICVIRDVRFFFNTLDRAMALLSEAGFPAGQERTETENGYEVKLFIPKTAETK